MIELDAPASAPLQLYSSDPAATGRFWNRMLGFRSGPEDAHGLKLIDTAGHTRIYVSPHRPPIPHTRIRLLTYDTQDLVAAAERLIALGGDDPHLPHPHVHDHMELTDTDGNVIELQARNAP